MMPSQKHIGLFFGSFNPIHTGHLIIGEQMLQLTDLEQIWFVVSPHNPFKKRASLLNPYDRLHLVRLAVEDNPNFVACDFEFSLTQPSYTIHTLAYLSEKYPQHQFSLLMGMDNLHSLPRWRNADIIIRDHQVFVYDRAVEDQREPVPHVKAHYPQVPLIDISSSDIRKMIQDGRSVRYLVPPKAYEYIIEMNYYQLKQEFV